MRTPEILNQIKPYVVKWIQDYYSDQAADIGVHSINGPLHTGDLDVDQFPEALLRSGARSLQGNLSVNSGIYIDSVDVGSHDHTGAAGMGVQLDHGGMAGLSDDDHPQYAALAQNETITGAWDFPATGVDIGSITISSDSGADIETSSGNLTLSPAGNLIVDPTGESVNPGTGYLVNLGAINYKYLTLHAAELMVETLVAQDTIATIGGRILVGPTTMLEEDMGSAAIVMTVKHKAFEREDIAYMEADGQFEAIDISGLAVANVDTTNDEFDFTGDYTAYFDIGTEFTIVDSNWSGDYVATSVTYSGGTTSVGVADDLGIGLGTSGYCLYTGDPSTGPYTYFVTRGFSSTGADDWYAGDAVFNTGKTDDGWIDLYSIQGVHPSTDQYGPTIVGNVRTGHAAFTDYEPHWAIGNLYNLYGYSTNHIYGAAFGPYSDDHITIDSTYGIRFRDGSGNTQAQLASAVWTIGRVASNYSNIQITSGSLKFRGGTNGTEVSLYIDTDGSTNMTANDSVSSWDDKRAYKFTHTSLGRIGGYYGWAGTSGLSTYYGGMVETYYSSSYYARMTQEVNSVDATAELRILANTSATYVQCYERYDASPVSPRVEIHPKLLITNSGDPTVTFDTGGIDWTVGIDDSDGDRFKISTGTSLGIADYFEIDTSGLWYKGGASTAVSCFVPLTTPITHTSFNGDTFSDVSTSTKIENTSWSSTIPSTATALLLQIIIKESGFIADGLYFSAGPSTSYYYAVSARPQVRNVQYEIVTPVPCTYGDIWYRINTTGLNTMTVYLRVWGYWI